MTVQDYLRVLREQWLIIVSAVVVALAAAGAVWLLRPPEYTARLTMYVSAQTADTAATAFEGAQLSQQRVSSYVELVGSTRVSREVIEELGLTGTPEEVAEQVTASSALDSVLIDVAVTGGSPEQVAAMANTVGDVFTGLVDELERPVTPGAVPPVAVRVVQPAPVPTAPSSTGLPVTLTLGLLAGLAVGVGGALARNALDTSVKALEQLREAANAPNLGTIAYDSDVPKRPLTVHEEPQSPRTEAFRQLRTNLQFVDVDNPRKVIVVTSSLPGEGKTTTLRNLAIALASAGSKVSQSFAIISLTSRDETMQRGGYEALERGKLLLTSDTRILREYFGPAAVYCTANPVSIRLGVEEVVARQEELRSHVRALQERVQVEGELSLQELRRYLND